MTGERKNLIAVSFSQFGAALSFNFILVFMPFHIAVISPYPEGETLLWTGAILGSSGLCLAVTSPLWGHLTHRLSPKVLYLRAIVVHAILFGLMGFTSSLPVLLVLRIIQGILGGVSTIALIIISSTSSPDRTASSIGFFQSFLTLGQLAGPPLGIMAVKGLGYRGAFLASSAIMFVSALFCYLFMSDVPTLPRKEGSGRWAILDRRVIAAWALCFSVQIQIMFLPSILPVVLPGLGVTGEAALRWAGLLVMLYTVTALAGTNFWPWLSRRSGLLPMITGLGLLSVFLQLALTAGRGIADFAVIRMVQTGLAAAIVPLVLSLFTAKPQGSVLGFLNAARFVGNALGPIMATTFLAFFGRPSVLYSAVAVLSLAALVPFLFLFRGEGGPAAAPRGPSLNG